MDRVELFKSRVGSFNYNLMVEESDKDYEVFVLPSWVDLLSNKSIDLSYKEEGNDILLRDIRHISGLVHKPNIKKIEVLFSKDLVINNEINQSVKDALNKLFEMKEDIARANLPYLCKSVLSSVITSFNQIEKGTESSRHLVSKHGYSTKHAMGCYRMLDFLKRYCSLNFTNFEKAITYSHEERQSVLDFRVNPHLNIDEVKNFIISEKNKVEKEIKHIYLNCEINTNTMIKVNDILIEILQEGLIKKVSI